MFFSDRTKLCVDAPAAGRLRLRDGDVKKETEQCMITFLGKTISTSSFAMYTFSVAVLVQAVTLVCFSSFADHGRSSVPLISVSTCQHGVSPTSSKILFCFVLKADDT